MYKCSSCETRYDLTPEHYEHIGVECEKNGVVSTVVICPGCTRARIVGAESDWDEFDNKPCHLMFGYDVEKEEDWSHGLVAFLGKREE